MMALAAPSLNERKRVKVYELKANDWYDRGTGFCAGHEISPEESRIYVQAEDDAHRALLETKITKDDVYQKQQDTLIVWTESNGVDMALSFQEAEGCASIWAFVSDAQQRMMGIVPEDAMTEDMIENGQHGILLPNPTLENLGEIENVMRAASSTAPGRDALAKFIMAPESLYIPKLVPLVEMAEDMEDLPDLHKLCNIMKTLILLNDTAIIEHVVSDGAVLGVVGALEYDPDFPSHKANHRQYLSDASRFKEVVSIEDPEIRKKIHYTYRLQYLKDVVLARILDDPTFSVLNSMIFFHQVDIVNHIQSNASFLNELFSIFNQPGATAQRKKDAVLFLQTCCAVAKNIQTGSRQQLYQNFIAGGLLNVVTFALRHHDPAVRVAGTDVLVALIDHDPAMMRTYIFKAINEKSKPLTDTLIELLLLEVDPGVKAQMSDAIRVLLDPSANGASMEMLGRTNGEFLTKMRSNATTAPQTETFIQHFYDDSAKKLFQPLKDLEHRKTLDDITIQEASLYQHLIEVLCFFIRCHSFRSKYFTLSEGLHSRVAQLLSCPMKHVKLSALKWLRVCLGLQDEFHNRQIIQHKLFEPVLDIVHDTMPRDNLLNSACLELFEFIKRETLKPVLSHLVDNYRERLLAITYVNTFRSLVEKHDEIQNGLIAAANAEDTSFSTQGAETPNRGVINGGQRWQSFKETDADEEAYFNTSDGEEEEENLLPTAATAKNLVNGASPVRSLVAYPDDDEDTMDVLSASPSTNTHNNQENSDPKRTSLSAEPESVGDLEFDSSSPAAPERLSEKRRREEEEEEDDLERLTAVSTPATKRRNSSASSHSATSNGHGHGHSKAVESPVKDTGPMLRRKGSLRSGSNLHANKLNSSAGTMSNGVKSSGTQGEGKQG